MNNDSCDSVFAPVCSPQVCNVPRIPYEQILVQGGGYISNRMCMCPCNQVEFSILIYRKLYDVFGVLRVMDEQRGTFIYSEKLEAYHSPKENAMVAIFHYEDQCSHNTRELAVYASIESENQAAKMYMYSAPLFDAEVMLGGEIECGSIKIEKSLAEHQH